MRIFLSVVVCVLIVMGLLIPCFFYFGFEAGGWILVMAEISALFYFPLLYFTADTRICTHYFTFGSCALFIALMYYSGGLHSPFLIWFSAIPPLVYLYLRRVEARFWFAVVSLAVLGFFVADIANVTFPQQISPGLSSFLLLFNYCMIALLFVNLVYAFARGFQKMNRKLGQSNQELKSSNEELERFAYIASHDLKSPLRNIVSFISLFKRRYSTDLDSTGREYIDFVSSNARQMHNLIEDILEYSRSNSHVPTLEVVDLNVVVNQIGQLLRSEPPHQQSIIQVNPLPKVMADRSRMQQLFQNLMENGLKYNESVRPEVSVSFRKRENVCQFVIRDNGIGIEKQFVDQIFDMFRRLHNQEKYPGTGIGLSICQKIALSYKGHIRVESSPTKGSTFFVEFPLDLLNITPQVSSDASPAFHLS